MNQQPIMQGCLKPQSLIEELDTLSENHQLHLYEALIVVV
jgi:hypothetical protein